MSAAAPRNWTLPALNPMSDDNGTWEVFLPQHHVDGLQRCGVTARFARIQLIPDVLVDPVAIFQGWDRDGMSDALCYVGHPSKDYRSVGIETSSAPPNMVFVVYVCKTGKIAEWGWVPSDQDNPEYPENFKSRFGRMIWPTKQEL